MAVKGLKQLLLAPLAVRWWYDTAATPPLGEEREIYGCVWETKQWRCPDNRRDSQRLWRDIWLNMFIIHSFYLAPFSAPQQTHCGLVKCDSEWVTASFYSSFVFLYARKWITDGAVWFLHCWCHVKLLPSRGKFCVHQSTMHQFTVSLHSKP